jgi:hypothetical protein
MPLFSEFPGMFRMFMHLFFDLSIIPVLFLEPFQSIEHSCSGGLRALAFKPTFDFPCNLLMMKQKSPRWRKSTILKPVMAFDTDDDGSLIKIPKKAHHHLPEQFVQIYAILGLIGKLDQLSTLIFFYLCDRMDSDSHVCFNLAEKEKFLQQIEVHSGRTYTIGAVNNSLQQLKAVYAIKPHKRSVFYIDLGTLQNTSTEQKENGELRVMKNINLIWPMAMIKFINCCQRSRGRRCL